MPPKKAATDATKPTRSTRQANGVAKAAPRATKAGKSAVEKAAPKKTAKRKATEEPDEPPTVNGTKRARHDTAETSPDTKKAKKTTTPTKRAAAAPKAAPAKKPKAKTLVNTPPTQILNVYVFGDGTNGELGLGPGKNCAEVKRPRLNALLDAEKVPVVQVSVGGMHTAVLTRNNKILTWGVNDQGALGRDTTWDGGLRSIDDDDDKDDSDEDSDDAGSNLNPRESAPAEVDLSGVPEGTVWTQVVCADSATFALTDEGLIYGCGTFRSNEGIFGFSPATKIQSTLTPVSFPARTTRVTTLRAGANHILALSNKGEIFAWGSGQQNQLGRRILERFLKNSLVPTRLGLPKNMVNIGAGAYHSFAMDKNGKVYSWGLNSFGETGVTDALDEEEGGSDVHAPSVVPGLDSFSKVIQIEGGSHHTIALTETGQVLVWGRLDGFQSGIKISDLPEDRVLRDSHGHPRILKVATQVPGLNGAAVAAGSDHSIAITREGKAYAWGFSTSYQTGLGTDDEVEVATMIDNTAVREKHLVWAGAGGQFSVIAGRADTKAPTVNGTH